MEMVILKVSTSRLLWGLNELVFVEFMVLTQIKLSILVLFPKDPNTDCLVIVIQR